MATPWRVKLEEGKEKKEVEGAAQVKSAQISSCR